MKAFLATWFFILVLGFFSKAQDTLCRYYDTNWKEVDKEQATFITEFIKVDSLFSARSYIIAGNVLYSEYEKTDQEFRTPVGLYKSYHPNQTLKDSLLYDSDSQLEYSYRFYPDSRLEARYYLPVNGKKHVSEGFDDNGARVEGYILLRKATFKNGKDDWNIYLKKNVASKIHYNPESNIKYLDVTVTFLVTEEGLVKDVQLSQSSGSNVIDQDALHSITRSPKWQPAILYNRKVSQQLEQRLRYHINNPNVQPFSLRSLGRTFLESGLRAL